MTQVHSQPRNRPEIQEDLEPEEQTLLRLRMESLLPEEALGTVAQIAIDELCLGQRLCKHRLPGPAGQSE